MVKRALSAVGSLLLAVGLAGGAGGGLMVLLHSPISVEKAEEQARARLAKELPAMAAPQLAEELEKVRQETIAENERRAPQHALGSSIALPGCGLIALGLLLLAGAGGGLAGLAERLKSVSLVYQIGWIHVLATLGLVAFYAPISEAVLGSSYLIFFFHFPSAINCLVFFAVAGLFSVAYLGTGESRWDRAALAMVEVGVLGCTITMVTGSIWAKAAWGVYWVWQDPRLMTVAIMWFTYLAYIALRGAIDLAAQRARFAAVFGIIATVNLPLVWFSIRLFGQRSHPMEVKFDSRMRVTMWFGALAFLYLYAAFARHRSRVARLRDRAREIEETLAR